VLTEQDVERARELYATSPGMTVDEIARAVGSSTTTLYRALKIGPKGLGEGRPRGRAGGRKPGLTDAQVKQLQRLYDQRELTVPEIGRQFSVAPATVYRYLKVG
jgi:predicted transcriptional regulator